RLFLLTGDKGYTQEDEIERRGSPQRAMHGSFSMMVNYHGLGLYFRQQGGLALQSSSRTGALKFCAYVSGSDAAAFPETALVFREAIDQFSPSDYFQLISATRKAIAKPPLDLIIPLLRLSDWDFQLVVYFSTVMAEQGKGADEALKRDLRAALE